MNDSIGQRMKQVRKRAGLGAMDTAERLGCAMDTLRRIESGEFYPNETQMYRFADFFGLTAAWLRYGDAPADQLDADDDGSGKDVR